MYRTPCEIVEDINIFNREFSLLLSYMKVTKHSCYVCGDYNIDLLKVKTKNHYSEYLDEVVSQGFIPRITLPTRISEQSSTLIDNIYTNNIDEGGVIWYFAESDIRSPDDIYIDKNFFLCYTSTKICRDPNK